MSEKPHIKTDETHNENMTNGWNFDNIPYITNIQSDADDGMEDITDSESEEIWEEMNPFIEKNEPKMLKKVFSGWKKRQNRYRQAMKEEMGDELDIAECEEVADCQEPKCTK